VLSSLTPGQQVIKIVNEELVALMGNNNARINIPNKPPCIIMMCGLQGWEKLLMLQSLLSFLRSRQKTAACCLRRLPSCCYKSAAGCW
jgi:signal recognition particle subunit SRP54